MFVITALLAVAARAVFLSAFFLAASAHAATVFWDDEMESGNSGYTPAPGAMSFDTSTKFSGNGSLRLDYGSECYPDKILQGFQCGGFTDRTFPDTSNLYRRFYMKVDNNFTIGDTETKIMASYPGGNSSVTTWWQFRYSHGLTAIISRSADGVAEVHAPSAEIPFGQWVCIETHEQLNTPGQANGVIELWVNGTQVLSDRNAMFLVKGNNTKFSVNRLYRQVGRGSLWFDRIAVGDSRIGCIGSPPPPEPPPADGGITTPPADGSTTANPCPPAAAGGGTTDTGSAGTSNPSSTPTPPGTGKNYYMSPSGNDNNPGTEAAPWKTLDRLQKAVNSQLRPGDTVWFRGGDYVVNDSVAIKWYSWRADGTASAPIIYRNYQGEKPVIIYDKRQYPGPNGSHIMIFLSGDHIIVDGLYIKQTEPSRRLGMDGSTLITREGNMHPLAIYGSNVTVRNVTLDNFGGPSILIQGNNAVVEHNTLINFGSHGFYVSGENGVFRYNVLDPRYRGYPLQEGINIQYGGTSGNKIYGNLIMNTQRSGVMISGRVSNNEVFNNVIINPGGLRGLNGGVAVGFWCEDGPIGSGNKFYNNTVIGKTGTFVSNAQCKNKDRGYIGRNVQIYNNIFNASTPVRAGLSGPNVRNNIYYNITGSVPPGNTLVNPMLKNPSGTTSADAMLQAGSPAIDKAIDPAPALDYQGGTRPVGPKKDIGAYEYGSVADPNAGGPLGGGGGALPPSTGCTICTPGQEPDIDIIIHDVVCAPAGANVPVGIDVVDALTGQPAPLCRNVYVGPIPYGFTLSAGTIHESRTGGIIYKLTPAELLNLTITPPPGYSGALVLHVSYTPPPQ